jgi:hypothetical protein
MTAGKDTGQDQGDLVAALLDTMFQAPAYQAPETMPAPPASVEVWAPEPAPVPAVAGLPAGPDWERIIPRIAAGGFTVLITAAVGIVAANWTVFVHLLEIAGGLLATLVLLVLLRGGNQSVTVTGRGPLSVFRKG